MKNIPLYRYPREYAEYAGELEEWQQSHKVSQSCLKAIRHETRDDNNGAIFPDAAQKVISKFGYDRVNWVLAALVEGLDHDPRISTLHENWLSQFKTHLPKKELQGYFIAVHPTRLDSFIRLAHKEWQDLGLFGGGHCLDESRNLSYKNQVLALKPKALENDMKSPGNQLVFAIGGSGCTPGALGGGILGLNLNDLNRCHYIRDSFIGILHPVHMPNWGRDNMKLIQDANPPMQADITMRGR